ncbi:bis(5'-nucleosyl)-tetraphosphatase [Bacillus coahuilensis p1.1.43]|uniref:Bis(5'-nucleosyl)-tetraphosphatase n=1 Tax=Bacillus coahuilensis p1.1.43 TaxID=1150625 RepID=A0A147KA20_9BACI|nr:bis(5'-nucleosyl)-tetraphosphatase PrpE [Bacillus coahuilensis]KUP07539.1 bis(5'-nucleosyl)-tetraphosphatase [Bacillus coahuilensis p1.1.43]
MKLDIIGDIHGCLDEFTKLTKKLGYQWINGIPLHPTRTLAFVGDLTDRGPNSVGVMEVVYQLWKEGRGIYSPGNHCNKLYRYLLGNGVKVVHGLETTVGELERLSEQEFILVKEHFIELYEQNPLYHVLDDGNVVIAHAGIKEEDIGKQTNYVKTFVLYGDITGEKNSDGTPVRRDWAKHHNGDTWIVYGHTPVKQPRFINRTVNIDTGCVFGGVLTALRYPEMETIEVQSGMPFIEEKFRSFD